VRNSDLELSGYGNPFPADADRAGIWEMLVERDIRAFVAGDWPRVAGDFLAESFFAVDGRQRANPDSWRLGLGSLDRYRRSWLEQSQGMREAADDLEAQLHDATTLRDIEIEGDKALAHKKFDGEVRRRDGGIVPLRWQTLYMCRRVDAGWKIAGFVGYLPNPMGGDGPA
jgi:hypothetical protein